MTCSRIAVRGEKDTGGGMSTILSTPYERWRHLLREKLRVEVDGPLLTRPDGRRFQIVRYESAEAIDIPRSNLRPLLRGGRGCRRLVIGMSKQTFVPPSRVNTRALTWVESGFDWEQIWAQYFYAQARLHKLRDCWYWGRVSLDVIGWNACWTYKPQYGLMGNDLWKEIIALTNPGSFGWSERVPRRDLIL